jgi:hypothetical protein
VLAQTKWDGDLTSIGSYLHVALSSAGAVISVTPSGSASGGSYDIATLMGNSAATIAGLLRHVITH